MGNLDKNKLTAALKKHSSLLDMREMNTEYVAQEVTECMGIVESLRSYREFLISAQRKKKITPNLSTSYTNEVIQQSYHATKEGYRFLSKSLKLVKHFKYSDGVEKSLNYLKKVLKDVGPSNFKDLWHYALNDEVKKNVIKTTGLSLASIDELSKVIEENDALISVKEGGIVMEDKTTDRKFKVLTAAESSKQRTKNIFSLLSANRLDVMAEVIDSPALVNVYTISSSRVQNSVRKEPNVETIDPYKSILEAALVAKAELNREFKQMEHTGIPVFRGQGGTLVFALVVIAVVVYVIGTIVVCKSDFQGSEDICKMLVVLLLLALYSVGVGRICITDEFGNRKCFDNDGNTAGTDANPGNIA